MTGDALASVEALDGAGGDADVELAFNEVVRYRVVMALDLDVIIDVHPGFLPLGVFVRCGRQRFERWPVDGLELAVA